MSFKISRLLFLSFLLAMSCVRLAIGADVETLVVFRDTLKPGSSEASRGLYETVAWSPEERASTLNMLKKIHSIAPGLLPRGASDGTISVYRAKLRIYAKAGPQRLALDEKVFRLPDYTFRIVLHEIVHSADCYNRFSGSEQFRKIYEPKIRNARELLKLEGLTPITAASLPVGTRRQQVEQAVRSKTGLPSAYACHSLDECLAEVVSFWVIPAYKYSPDKDAIRLLTPFVYESAPPNPVDVNYRKAEVLYRQGKVQEAIKKWTEVIESDPAFYQAYSDRGHVYHSLNMLDRAVQDLKKCRDLVSPYQSTYDFYDAQWKRIHKLAQ